MPGRRKRSETGERPIPKNFIRAWRKYRQLTIEQLVEKSGLSKASISNMETGKDDVTGRSLFELANALNTTPGKLFEMPGMQTEWGEIWEGMGAVKKERALYIVRAVRDAP